MKKIFLLVFIALLIFGGYVYWQLNADTDNTNGWNIYKDRQHGFQIKYPPDWVAVDNPDGVALVSFAPPNIHEGIVMKIYKNKVPFTASSLKDLERELDKYHDCEDYCVPGVELTTPTNINGWDVILVELSTGYLDRGFNMYLLIDNGDILGFIGDISPIYRKIFGTLKNL